MLEGRSLTTFTKSAHYCLIFWEGHKIFRNLPRLFVLCSASQIIGGDFEKFCGLLRIYELYLGYSEWEICTIFSKLEKYCIIFCSSDPTIISKTTNLQIFPEPTRSKHSRLFGLYLSHTDKSVSEPLIFASNNYKLNILQYDNRLFIKLPVQYMKSPSSEHSQDMYCTQIVCFDIQNNLCTQNVLALFWAWNFHVLNW